MGVHNRKKRALTCHCNSVVGNTLSLSWPLPTGGKTERIGAAHLRHSQSTGVDCMHTCCGVSKQHMRPRTTRYCCCCRELCTPSTLAGSDCLPTLSMHAHTRKLRTPLYTPLLCQHTGTIATVNQPLPSAQVCAVATIIADSCSGSWEQDQSHATCSSSPHSKAFCCCSCHAACAAAVLLVCCCCCSWLYVLRFAWLSR